MDEAGVFGKAAEIILGQGVLGVIAIALGWAYYKCRERLDLVTERHLADVKATLEAIHASNVTITNSIEVTRQRSETAAAIAKAQELAAAEQARNTAEIIRLREAAEKASDQYEALVREVRALQAILGTRGAQ
jgi:hypothetical protein